MVDDRHPVPLILKCLKEPLDMNTSKERPDTALQKGSGLFLSVPPRDFASLSLVFTDSSGNCINDAVALILLVAYI